VDHSTFRFELVSLLNRASAEQRSNTPDFVLAAFLLRALDAFDHATKARDNWYLGGRHRHDPRQGGHQVEPCPRCGQVELASRATLPPDCYETVCAHCGAHRGKGREIPSSPFPEATP